MNERIQEMAKFARREASLYGGKFGDADFTKRYNEIFAEMIMRERHLDIQQLVDLLSSALEAWDYHQQSGEAMQGDWVFEARAALAKWEGKI